MKINFKVNKAPWEVEKKVKNLPPKKMRHGRQVGSLNPMPDSTAPFGTWQFICDELGL